MKRDYVTGFVFLIIVSAVTLLAVPQIAALRNPSTSGLPNQTANLAALTSAAMPPLTSIPTHTVPPTIPLTATLSFTSTIPVAPTVPLTATRSITSTHSITPTNALTPTNSITPTVSITSTNFITPTGETTPVDNIKIQNFAYAPSSLTIPMGTTVKWTQLDKTVPHTVSAGSPANPNPGSPFNSGSLTADGTDTYEFTFQQPGIFPYYCTFHTEMRGLILVANAEGNVPTRAPATPVPTATPFIAPPPAGALVVATGLINPRGFVKGPDGALYVAEAGTVPETVNATNPLSATTGITATKLITGTGILTTTATPTPPSPQPRGTVNPICESQLPSYDKLAAGCPGAQGPQVSNNGRISRIAPDGTRMTIAENLPATVGPFNDIFGVNSVAFIGNDLYVIIAAGATRGHPDFPTGVYRVADGKTTLVANLEEFQKLNPPKFIPDDYNYSLPYDVLALGGKLYITDGNAAVVFEVDPSKPLGTNIERIVDLSPTHNVLTGISAGADGAIYFTDFTPAPYPVGGAQVFKWTPQAGLTTVTAGLSIATGMAVAPDGTMYASEFATALGKAPFMVPPGRVVKFGTDGKVETVATPLVYPTALRWLDGTLFVTNYGVNAVEGEEGKGAILRLALP